MMPSLSSSNLTGLIARVHAAARTYDVILVVQKLWLEMPNPSTLRVVMELGEGGTAGPITPGLQPKAMEITHHTCRLNCRRKV